MARINRSDVIQKAVNDLALSVSDEVIPNQTLDKVQCVYSLNKQFSSFIISSQSASTGTLTLTMPTVDSRSEIYITGADFDMVKDATCDIATSTIGLGCTPDSQGIAKTLLGISVLTLTAQQQHAHVDFAYPIRVKNNTNLTVGTTYSLGLMSRSASVYGFITSTN